ncbi:hypothetical protein ACLK19_10870 [Escherichia coli]
MWRCNSCATLDIAAKGVLPTCQDTGTAIIVGKKRAACMDRWL